MISKSGSALLFILLLTMIICTYFINRIRSMSYLLDIACKREQFEEQYYATQALLTVGIVYVSKIDRKKSAQSLIIETDQWLSDNKNCHGKIKINRKESSFYIESLLIKNNKVVCSLSCVLSKDKKNQLFEGKNRERFIISNFQQRFSAV
jgi:hypothetical protein